MKQQIKYMIHLDGIRAFAVGGVILEHWASGLPKIIREFVHSIDFGGLGVECFFVLSGFLITLIMLEGKDADQSIYKSLGHFYGRRILRIFPAYYLLLLVIFFLFPLMHDFMLMHTFYLSNLYPLWSGSFIPIGGHLWSLSVEEQFYIFWPLIVFSFPIRTVKYLAILLCLIAPISRFFLWQVMGEIHLSMWTFTTTCLDLLCFGAFLACVKTQTDLSPDSQYLKILRLVGLSAFLFYIILHFYYRDSLILAIFGRSFTALFFGAFVVVAANGFKGPLKLAFGNDFIVWIGLISYGLYLYHPFIPMMYLYIIDFLNLERDIFGVYYIRYPLLTIMLLLVTSLSYYFIESPIRKFRKFFL